MKKVRRDVALALLTAALLFASVPLAYGSLGLSWDALNHHFYLGWTALHPRLDLDVDAAHSQAYQYPYLYAPLYLLAASGTNGLAAGIALACLQSLVAIPLALLSWRLLPGDDPWLGALRWFSVVMGLCGPVVLSQMDSTSNDLLASIPLLFTAALLVGRNPEQPHWWRTAALAAALGGVSVGFKLSNGPMLLATAPLWLLASPSGLANWLRTAFVASVGAVLGFALAYFPWGWQLWRLFGNPFYPMFDGWFHPNPATEGGGSGLMTRFIPDTWAEALARPLVMADPSTGVYAEIPAPDIRFAVAVVLAVWLGALVWKRRARLDRAVFGLLSFVVLAFALWEMTSGNGRYFIPVLLVIGPLVVVLLHRLPVSRRLIAFLGLATLSLQGLAMNSAWAPNEWALGRWKERYFDLRIPPKLASTPATFVTASGISFSLIAPLFDERSSWVSLSEATQRNDASTNGRIAALISKWENAYIIGARLDSQFNERGQPGPRTTKAINELLGIYSAKLHEPLDCEFLESTSLPKLPIEPKVPNSPLIQGFTMCRIVHAEARVPPVGDGLARERQQRAEAVFAKLERVCPKFFPPAGKAPAVRSFEDYRRNYGGTDVKTVVLDDGTVFYKYYRALNPVVVGDAAVILRPDFTMACDRLQGKYRFPWDKDL